MELNGAQIVVKCLEEQGVDTVFGYPGGTILNVYDALYEEQDRIRHILTAHEQGAAHAADGYARATGRVGVCLATSGPGATNLVTGIATAYMDSVPLVAITCNVNLQLLGKDTFQEVDIVGITMPITKHGYIVKDVSILADTIRRAFAIARSGRPGPVIVDITKDVTAAVCEYTPSVPVSPVPASHCSGEELDRAAAMLMEAKRPFLYVGGGAVTSGAFREVRELAELLGAPVCETLMAQGVVDQRDPRYTGMVGMHGTKTSNYGVSQCDLLVALGARFSDRVTGNACQFAGGARILQIDIDAAEINKNVKASFALVGDLKELLSGINARLEPQHHSEWMQTLADYSRRFPLAYDHSRLSCPEIMETLERMTGANAIITTDVGQHQMWAAQFYHYSMPRCFLSSGGLGTMGYGLGAAIGAKTACPDRVVVNIGGDGCFRMNMIELATASRYRIPVIQIIIDNQVLGMVRQWQTLFYGKRYSQTVLEDKVDFVRTAEGLGCRTFRVTNSRELEKALSQALQENGPTVLDCIIDRDDKVYPMVPPGASIDTAFDASDRKE